MKPVLPFVALFALILVSISGCKKDDNPVTPPTPSLSGTWSGSASGATIRFTASESSNSANGSGQMTAGSVSLALTITGTHVHPNVTLTMTASGYQPMNFQGSFTNDNTIVGKLNGSGYVDTGLTFVRQ